MRRTVAAGVAAVAAAATMAAGPSEATTTLTPEGSADEVTALADPQPVLNGNFPDPAVKWTGDRYVGMATGWRVRMSSAPYAKGPWASPSRGLAYLPDWANKNGGIWAPEFRHVRGDTWVMYYSAKVTGLVDGNQRCIGVARSTNGPTGRYTPVHSRPLVCPPGSDSPGASAPVTGGVGLIDPSTFITANGRHILLFKSQKPNPGTRLWSVVLNDNWTWPTSSSKVLIRRANGQIENPEMVRRGGKYYLFASWNSWANCSYRTVWLKNDYPRVGWKFPDGFPGTTTSRGGTLIKSGRGLCGPGGMSVAWKNGNTHFFLHAYRDADHNRVKDSSIRRMYAGRIAWTSTGRPWIKWFFSPA